MRIHPTVAALVVGLHASNVLAEPEAAAPERFAEPRLARLFISTDQQGSPDDLETPAANIERSTDPFAKGAKYWSLTLGHSRDPDLGRIYLAQFSLDEYVFDGLAIRAGLNFGYADADRTDGGFQGGPELGFRWHFFSREGFSAYIDGSAGAVVHENPLTPESLRFNFDLQAGIGATLRLTEEKHLQGGWRWHHLSNARIRGTDRNLGYDGPMLYLGLLLTY